MSTIKLDIERNAHIGLFMVATDKFVLVPDDLDKQTTETIADVLKVDPIPLRISGTTLLGVFAAANSRGVVLPHIARKEEIQKLNDYGIETLVIEDTATALGNLIAANDRGVIISKALTEENAKKIAEFLGAKKHARMNIAGTELTGASIAVTNRGFVAHPNTRDEELDVLEDVFGVEGTTSTANYGDPFVRASIVANSYGLILGERTSPVEILRIEDVLG
ncbi:MAG: translation initiation factor IF-6 [Candidatus Diapherotrites archaeon]|nr:translation initiation factor IF-6 [Candidatus Diapherotrites archaeon]